GGALTSIIGSYFAAAHPRESVNSGPATPVGNEGAAGSAVAGLAPTGLGASAPVWYYTISVDPRAACLPAAFRDSRAWCSPPLTTNPAASQWRGRRRSIFHFTLICPTQNQSGQAWCSRAHRPHSDLHGFSPPRPAGGAFAARHWTADRRSASAA